MDDAPVSQVMGCMDSSIPPSTADGVESSTDSTGVEDMHICISSVIGPKGVAGEVGLIAKCLTSTLWII